MTGWSSLSCTRLLPLSFLIIIYPTDSCLFHATKQYRWLMFVFSLRVSFSAIYIYFKNGLFRNSLYISICKQAYIALSLHYLPLDTHTRVSLEREQQKRRQYICRQYMQICISFTCQETRNRLRGRAGNSTRNADRPRGKLTCQRGNNKPQPISSREKEADIRFRGTHASVFCHQTVCRASHNW